MNFLRELRKVLKMFLRDFRFDRAHGLQGRQWIVVGVGGRVPRRWSPRSPWWKLAMVGGWAQQRTVGWGTSPGITPRSVSPASAPDEIVGPGEVLSVLPADFCYPLMSAGLPSGTVWSRIPLSIPLLQPLCQLSVREKAPQPMPPHVGPELEELLQAELSALPCQQS